MSKSPTPKGTPVQRSPSDGVPESLSSPQQSTPQQKKRISSLLQSPVRSLIISVICVSFFFCSLDVIIFHIWMSLL